MLMTEGKNQIRRYLAGYVPSIAQTMVFGIGQRSESLTDISLHLETAKSPILSTYYDFTLNKLIYKASVPDEYVGQIYEIGLYSLDIDPASGEFSSRIITTFDSATENWVDAFNAPAPFTSVTTRVGADSLSLAPSTSGNKVYSLSNIALDLSGYSAADSFTFAFNSANSNVSSMKIRFMTDNANYYDFNIGSQTTGYKIIEMQKGTAAVTGNPNWTNISSIQVTVVASSSGAASVEFDAIRIEDKDSASLDYILVARKVLATPAVKIAGLSQDAEFSLDITL